MPGVVDDAQRAGERPRRAGRAPRESTARRRTSTSASRRHGDPIRPPRRAREELAVERVDVVQQPVHGVMREDVARGRASARASAAAGSSRTASIARGQCGGVAAAGTSARARPPPSRSGVPPTRGGDHRAARGQRLDERDRRALVARASSRPRRGRRRRSARSRAPAEEGDARRRGPGSRACCSSAGAHRRRRRRGEAHVRAPLRARAGAASRKRRHVLDRHQPADDPDERRAVGEPRGARAGRRAAAGRASGSSSRPSGTTRILSRGSDAQRDQVVA